MKNTDQDQLASLEVTVNKQVTKVEISQEHAKMFQEMIATFEKNVSRTPSIYMAIRDSKLNHELKSLLLKIRLTQDFDIECVYPVSFRNHWLNQKRTVIGAPEEASVDIPWGDGASLFFIKNKTTELPDVMIDFFPSYPHSIYISAAWI